MTATFAHDPGQEPAWNKLDEAMRRGFDPTPDDLLPPPAHLEPPTGVNPLAWFIRETRALQIVGPLTRCAHPFCRTSVTEDDVSFCPHNLPFCEACCWEDGCDDCGNGGPTTYEEAS